MLNFIREKSHSLVTKILIGLCAIALVILFATESGQGQRGQGFAGPIGSINGEPVNGLFYNSVLSQIFPNQAKNKELPPFVVQYYQQQTNEQVIRFFLTKQFLKNSGLWASAEELAFFIRQMPEFQKNGKFDKEIYDRMNPERESLEMRGMSYNEMLRRDLGSEKLMDTFETLIYLDENHMKKIHELTSSKSSYEVVQIPKEAPASEKNDMPDESTETPEIENKIFGEDAAKKTYDDWKRGATSLAELEKSGVVVQKKDDINILDLKDVLGNQSDFINLQAILDLSEKKPFLENPLLVGNDYYLIRLTKSSPSKPDEFTKKRDQIAESMKQDLQNKLMLALLDELKSQAKIDLSIE